WVAIGAAAHGRAFSPAEPPWNRERSSRSGPGEPPETRPRRLRAALGQHPRSRGSTCRPHATAYGTAQKTALLPVERRSSRHHAALAAARQETVELPCPGVSTGR